MKYLMNMTEMQQWGCVWAEQMHSGWSFYLQVSIYV